jgi:cytoskeletal protein CcmA (bactofilin family)
MFGAKKTDKTPKKQSTSMLNSLVAGTVITGNVSSKMDIRIDGRLEGTLNSEAKVVVGKNALISGNIVCQTILIEGRVEGNITAKEKLHIQSNGSVVGDLITHKLIIEDGAVFNGASIMGKTPLMKNTKNGDTQRKILKEVQKVS